MRNLSRLLTPLWVAVKTRVARGVVSLVNDSTKAQLLQLELLAGEVADQVERFGEYGFTSVPLPGSEAAVVFLGSSREHGLVIAVEDRRYRLKGLAGGEVALYDDQGQHVHLKRGPELELSSDTIRLAAGGSEIVLDASGVTIDGALVTLTVGATSIRLDGANIDMDGPF